MFRWLCVFGLVLLAANAQGASDAGAGQPLLVATREAPPFSIKGSSGVWRGISVDLWEKIASQLELSFEYREMGLGEMLGALEHGEVDLAVAALTVTSERERRFDFSHPFYSSGLGMAVHAEPREAWLAVLRRLASPRFVSTVGGLLGLLFIVGLLVWLAERRRNPQFGGSSAQGVGAGLWWSAVTMTTVGYGDKVPVTFLGRCLGLIWMFAGILIISSFTAAITTALTLGELSGKVRGPEDLSRVRVLTVAQSTSERFLEAGHYAYRTLPDLDSALRALAEKEADTVVYDRPILVYRIHQAYPGVLSVLPMSVERQDYGIGFPGSSGLREPVNQQLLSLLSDASWQDTLDTYLGTAR